MLNTNTILSKENNGIFCSGGEAGKLLSGVDWSKHALGPIEKWPQSLRTSLSICLSSQYPICLIWGNERIYLYNDAYTPIVGSKHPWALARPYPVVWPEIWEKDIKPILESVEVTGRASWCDNLLLVLERYGYPEECYFSFSFAPVRDEQGGVGGVFTAITETTKQVIGQRRLKTLRDLASRAAESKTVHQVCLTSAAVLSENKHDVPFSAFYLFNENGEQIDLAADTGFESAPLLRQELFVKKRHDLLRDAIKQSDLVVQDNFPDNCLPGGPWSDHAKKALILPIFNPSQKCPYGYFVAGISPKLALDSDYRDFFNLVVNQVSNGISNALAFEEEKKRAQALAEIDRAKTAFFSNVSHEFRTPLTLMLGPLEDTLANFNGTLPLDAAKDLTVVHRNGLRLLRLVNTLLDFSRIEAGRIEASYEPTDLASFTAELASVFRSAVNKAGLQLIVDCPPLPELVHVDREMWEKIVLNLLSNAFKFTFEGEIKVTLRWQKEQVELCVTDTGVGIPEKDLAKVFERFHRVKNTRARTHEGTGIGLALVRELVRLHGGEVSVQSQEGRGSIFRAAIRTGKAHLPSDRINAERRLASTSVRATSFVEESLRWLPETSTQELSEAVLPSISESSNTAARVLIVDDNADMREYLHRLLVRKYAVEVAADGQEAFERIQEEPPDLVLSDIMMPRLDGFGLIEKLRACEKTNAIPVILLSARAGEEARVEGMAAGADDYLIKPFSARELIARVESHLNLARLRHETEEKLREREAWLVGQREALEVAMNDASLEEALGVLVRTVTRGFGQDTRAAFYLANAEGTALHHVVGMHPDYARAVDGFKIGPESLSCGLATYTGQPILTADVMKEPLWKPWCWLAERFDFRGCWSFPIHTTARKYAGTLAVYWRQPREATKRDLELISLATNTAALIVARHTEAKGRKLAEEALRQNEERYRQLANLLPVALYTCDADGMITYYNPEAARLWGRAPKPGDTDERFCGSEQMILPNGQPLPHDQCPMAVALRDGSSFRQETVNIRRPDGSQITVQVNIDPIRDNSGRITGAVNVFHDVTSLRLAEQALRESEERFRMLADNMSQLAWMCDKLGDATWYNKRWLDYTGFSFEEMRGYGWKKVLHPEHIDRVVASVTHSRESGKIWEDTFPLRGKDGQYRWFLSRAIPIHNERGEIVRWFGTNTDITEQKLVEDQLKRSNHELEQFAYISSHDLQEPLRTISSYADLLQLRLKDKLDEENAKYFGYIQDGALHAQELIQSLLQYASITTKDYPFESADLNFVAQQVIAHLHSSIEESKAEIVYDDLPKLKVNSLQIAQLFQNLISNALKYRGKEPPKIHVSCRKENYKWIFAVRDNGIGIDPQYKERVFMIFKRLHSKNEYSGVGIGLAVCKKIVEHHGGEIWLESVPGKGSTFYFSLPLDGGGVKDDAP